MSFPNGLRQAMILLDVVKTLSASDPALRQGLELSLVM